MNAPRNIAPDTGARLRCGVGAACDACRREGGPHEPCPTGPRLGEMVPWSEPERGYTSPDELGCAVERIDLWR